jgi:hypothetical protein
MEAHKNKTFFRLYFKMLTDKNLVEQGLKQCGNGFRAIEEHIRIMGHLAKTFGPKKFKSSDKSVKKCVKEALTFFKDMFFKDDR